MIRYKTIAKEGFATQTIEKSKFIAHITPVCSKEAADCFIQKIRDEYKDASHNVPCYIIGEKQELMWASDDGEPQGTSGAPIMQMLQKEGITNICIVVTRYFGGIKLGTGGLVRAYTGSASLALSNAGIKYARDMIRQKAEVPYTALSKIENFKKECDFSIENIVYSDKITLDLIYEPETEKLISEYLRDITSGNAKFFEKFKFIY